MGKVLLKIYPLMNIQQLFLDFKWRFVLMFCLILAEAGLSILFPLFIGWAIDDALKNSYTGALLLGGLGILVLLIGVSRRVLDSRFYAKIFINVGTKTLHANGEQSESVKTARLQMLKEIVEFLENSLPELIQEIIGLVGVIIILAFLHVKILIGGIIALLLVFLVYIISGEKTIFYNQAYNNELEQQVDVIASKNSSSQSAHLKKLMHWNVKLSDLEALNFSFSWLFLMAFLVISIILAVQDGVTQYGALLALVMYVFQLIENVVVLPLYYQHWLRLTEIMQRIGSNPIEEGSKQVS